MREAGAGRSWEPAWLWNYYTGGADLDPVVTVSEMTMTDYTTELAESSGRPARDGKVTFQGTRVKVVNARPGRSIDPAAGPRGDHGGVPRPTTPPRSSTWSPSAPDIDDADVRAAVQGFANPAVSGPVTLVFDKSMVRLQPRDFVAVLSLRASNGSLEPHVDQEKLLRLVDEQVAGNGGAPVDATVALVDGRPKVIPSKSGHPLRPGRGHGGLHRGADQAGGRT